MRSVGVVFGSVGSGLSTYRGIGDSKMSGVAVSSDRIGRVLMVMMNQSG